MLMKLSIIIPCYNEEGTIETLLSKVENVDIGEVNKQIIIIDDGSTDKTGEIARDYTAKSAGKDVISISKKNGGKGSAIREGLKNVHGDIIIIQDADMEYDPNDYNKLLKPILDGKSKVVYGSRFLGRSEKMYSLHAIGNKGLTWLFNFMFGSKLTDMETCYKMFTREVADQLKLTANRFEIEPEITSQIIKLGYNIQEVPINFKGRRFEEGKKITWRDGIKTAFYLVRYKFSRIQRKDTSSKENF